MFTDGSLLKDDIGAAFVVMTPTLDILKYNFTTRPDPGLNKFVWGDHPVGSLRPRKPENPPGGQTRWELQNPTMGSLTTSELCRM